MGGARALLATLLFGLPAYSQESPPEPLHEKFPGAAEPTTAAAEFGEMVRTTAWRTPGDELAGFHLPPGFEIRLYAAEPQIAKPLNMAFDERGRLWLTQTTAYPYPDPSGTSPGDAIKVLEDTDGDGHADRVTTFADGLNIPMGVLPYGDGCLAFNMPNLYYLRDTDGDGVCDTREVVLGPFDTSRDTHGMVNSLRDPGDGWIYACHGFNNRSVVAGSDGHEVRLESGNSFRFRADGSRVELVTQGQVNPFGMSQDQWGYWYSADCHSKPISQLIRGACYPSFGRPDDGLGFLPPMMDHFHGSTAISGLLAIPDDSAITPLRGQMISGNVMTSRLNRNLVRYHGATATGIELPDFLTSDDSWFRPVDIQIDADNHLYIADFYNRIIGHYEVPLEHPDRDRTSGRIWQVRYVGPQEDGHAGPQAGVSNVAFHDLRPLVDELMRLADLPAWTPQQRQRVVQLSEHDNVHVVRAAWEAIGRVPGNDGDLSRLVARLLPVDAQDHVLRQTLRIALRNRLQQTDADAAVWDLLMGSDVPLPQRQAVASVLLAVTGDRVVGPLVRYLDEHRQAPERSRLVRHAALQASGDQVASVVRLAREISRDSIPLQEELLDALASAQAGTASGPLRSWALELAESSLRPLRDQLAAGQPLVTWSQADGTTWQPQNRQTADGQTVSVISSITRGEAHTGVLRSSVFPMPAQIGFFLVGHRGGPNQSAHERNQVRLVRVSDGQVLQQAFPPRSDIGVWIDWPAGDDQGVPVQIEVADGDSGGAYAWLAVGGFQPSWLDQGQWSQQLLTALRWTQRMQLRELEPPLDTILHSPPVPASFRWQVASTTAQLRGQNDWTAVLGRAQSMPSETLESLLVLYRQASGDTSSDESAAAALMEALQRLTEQLAAKDEAEFFQQWVQSGGSVDRLLAIYEAGWLNPASLLDSPATEVVRAKSSDNQRARLDTLLSTAQPLSSEMEARRQALLAGIQQVTADPARGQALFRQHCAACHQLRGVGETIGPQLDGVLTRSNERLVEDIVLPDRNVDHAFRTTSFLMDDGRVIVGMVQADDDDQIRLADATGKVIAIETDAVEMRIESTRSLMPSDFIDVLTADDLAHLLGFMRGQ